MSRYDADAETGTGARDSDQQEYARRGPMGRLLYSITSLTATLLATLETRLELLGADVQHASRSAASLLLWSLVAVLVGGISIIFLGVTLLVIYWDTHRILVAALVSVFCLSLTAFSIWRALSQLRKMPDLFAGTMEELAKDRDKLRQR